MQLCIWVVCSCVRVCVCVWSACACVVCVRAYERASVRCVWACVRTCVREGFIGKQKEFTKLSDDVQNLHIKCKLWQL